MSAKDRAPDRVIVDKLISSLKPYPGNARTHSLKQLKQIAASIERFGFTNPVLVSDSMEIIAGHGRVEAAKLLDWKSVPTLELSHMTAEQRRAYVIADNKLALNAGWDKEVLAIELQSLLDLEFDLGTLGFEIAEIDFILDGARQSDSSAEDDDDDRLPPLAEKSICQTGDLWTLGRHRLICGDTLDASVLSTLMGDELADMAFLDPPYNVAVDGHVCGKGAVKHREFAYASGEMSRREFTEFLSVSLGNVAGSLRDGAIAFVCMDWRHMQEMLDAGHAAFDELKNLVVWNKTNGGMGTFYRSKHELIFVFKKGSAEHVNSFGLGDTGRYRTNVWDYAGISSIGPNRNKELAMHPTVKPVELIADAMRDCSKRGNVILDGFGGSGSTLIAAEKVGRRARLVEYDRHYCDTIIRRWENYTGKLALHSISKKSFQELFLAETG